MQCARQSTKLIHPLADWTPEQCWNEERIAAIPPTPASLSLQADMLQQVEAKRLARLNHNNALQSMIAGGVVQTQLYEHAEAASASEQTRLAGLVEDALVRLEGAVPADMRWKTSKVLSSTKGKGAQPVHWDSVHWNSSRLLSGASSRSALTVLLVVKDCWSTRFRCRSRSKPSRMYNEATTPEMMVDSIHELREQNLYSVWLPAGALLLFLHNVPHAGAACTTDLRVMMFNTAVFSPRCSMDPDQQYFIWNHFYEAYGPSDQYRQCLLDNRKHDPFTREANLAKRRAMRALCRRNSMHRPRSTVQQHGIKKRIPTPRGRSAQPTSNRKLFGMRKPAQLR